MALALLLLPLECFRYACFYSDQIYPQAFNSPSHISLAPCSCLAVVHLLSYLFCPFLSEKLGSSVGQRGARWLSQWQGGDGHRANYQRCPHLCAKKSVHGSGLPLQRALQVSLGHAITQFGPSVVPHTSVSPSRNSRLCDCMIPRIIRQSLHIHAGAAFFQICLTFTA